MKIIKKISEKAKDNMGKSGVTVAFLGASVVQGCFEIFLKNDKSLETVYDQKHAIHTYFKEILSVLYPSVPVNIINAGISGDTAPHGLERLENDVLLHRPDLTVVSFGLNDCGGEYDGLKKYIDALRGIFTELKKAESEIIFMTTNMMNTDVSCHIKDEIIKNIAGDTMRRQNEGILEMYMNEAKKLCDEMGVIVCDCYEKWKILYENGVDVTELLANRINHPIREMNMMPAMAIVETMMMN